MEQTAPNKKLEPGVYQGTPESPDKKQTPSRRVIRTMQNDAEEAIKTQNETAVSIALAEEKKRVAQQAKLAVEGQAQNEPSDGAPKRVGRTFVIFILVLIIISVALAFIFVLPKIKNITLPTATPATNEPTKTITPIEETPKAEPLAISIIPAQSEKRFNIANETPEKIFAEISNERKHGISASAIKNFYIYEDSGTGAGAVSVNRFISFANIQVPEIFIRSLENDFMVGFFGESNGGTAPFIILKVSDYEIGLAGILEWEKDLPRFFDTVFGTNIMNGVTTMKFNDIVVGGNDARYLNVVFGNTVAYAFVNKNTLVIAGSLTSLNELMPLAGKN
ncbi:MAG: hypothetical protein WBC83_03230 [Minisyncoccia bacterium]